MGKPKQKNKLPAVRGKDVAKVFEKAGGKKVRQKGSHAMYKINDELVPIPMHVGKIIPPGTLSNILRQAKMSKEEFNRLLGISIGLLIINSIKKLAMFISMF